MKQDSYLTKVEDKFNLLVVGGSQGANIFDHNLIKDVIIVSISKKISN